MAVKILPIETLCKPTILISVIKNSSKALAENDIKTLDDFAGLTTDDLIGYFEIKGDKNSKVLGLLEEFNLTREEGDQLIMEARKIWLD